MSTADVNATIIGILATGVTLWAALIAAALLFPERAERAKAAVEVARNRTLGTGILFLLTVGIFGLVLASQANGLLKLIGMVMLAVLLLLAIIGSAGLALLVAERMRRSDDNLAPLPALGRAGGLLIAAGFLPVLGWFLLFPIALVASLGAGVTAVFGRPKGGHSPLPPASLLPRPETTHAAETTG